MKKNSTFNRIGAIILLLALTLGTSSWNYFSAVHNGIIMNMQMTSSNGIAGNIKLYYDTAGTRIEISATSSSGYAFNKTSIVRKAEPGIVYQVEPTTKTYTTVDVSNQETDKNDDPATATLIGTDSINGYKCKHSTVVQGKKKWEVWATSSITEYAEFSAVMNHQRYIGNHGVHEALKAINAEGFPVKIILTDERGEVTTTELKSVEHKPLDASLFVIPADYKKGAAGPPMGMPGGYPHGGH